MLSRRSIVTGFTVALLFLCTSAIAANIERGESLAAALEKLRGEGLQLIFSSSLIGSDLVVDVDAGSGTPEEIARRILASHGLTLERIHPGFFAVVKRAAQKAGTEREARAQTTPSR